MKTSAVLALVLWSVQWAFAQPNSAIPKNLRASNTLDNLFDANGLTTSDNLYGIPLESGRVVGNAYLNADWKRTTFVLYASDKMIEGYPSRYEIDQDQFEIKAADAVKVLNGKRVRSFVWVDSLSRIPHYFVNGKDFKNEENTTLSGFFEVLAEGPYTLLEKSEVQVIEPTYKVQLDMGNRDQRIIKKRALFYAEKGIVKRLPSSRKKLLPLFGTHASEIEKFIKVNSLDLDNAMHLKVLFEHYHALIAAN
jgi:hypothetical protein